MKLVIDIPDEQIKKSLEESKYIHEDEGEKGSVHITMLYTNARLEFVEVERKKDFYPCAHEVLPKGHGRLIDVDLLRNQFPIWIDNFSSYVVNNTISNAPTIIEADKEGIKDEKV